MEPESDLELLRLYQNVTDSDVDALEADVRYRLLHARLHEQHKSHDAMHALMLLILFASVMSGQIILVQWKKRCFKSYQIATLFWMWLIPVFVSCMKSWWRFVSIWTVYSVLTMLIMCKARQKQISCSTPRLVYKWFLALHKLSLLFGVFGYVVLIGSLIGVLSFVPLSLDTLMDVGVIFMFYGTYFGLLSRDFAEICSITMAAHIGYYSSDGFPSRTLENGVCAVCGNRIDSDHGRIAEKAYRLNCGHVFHEFCIRGWCIVGKNQMCPYCREKVDLKAMFPNVLEKPDIFYAQMLDFFRYLVAWQPLIIFLVHGINYALGLE